MNPIVRKIHADPELRARIVAACAQDGNPLTSQALHVWKTFKRGVPAARVMTVARVLRMEPHEIRPDIFPPPRSRRFGRAAAAIIPADDQN